MSVVVTLRDHENHAGTMLVHETAEDVVLGNVFGILKNFPPDAVLNPWLAKIGGGKIPAAAAWRCSFWDAQPHPTRIREGSTHVDLKLESEAALVFNEVKMSAGTSSGTTHTLDRDQIIRNLDVGYARAAAAQKTFAVIYITPDAEEPPEAIEVRKGNGVFPENPGVDPKLISSCFFWCNWGSLGDAVLTAVEQELLHETERKFAFDLLAYLRKKELWNGPLSNVILEEIHEEKLYEVLLQGSDFAAFHRSRNQSDQSWRSNSWDDAETELRQLLAGLQDRPKALLKLIAESGGAITQARIFDALPFLGGKSGALSGLKRQVSAACRSKRRASILHPGIASSRDTIHAISPGLGKMHTVVVEVARLFTIPTGVL